MEELIHAFPVKIKVTDSLSVKDIISLLCTSSKLKKIMEDEELWRIYATKFPNFKDKINVGNITWRQGCEVYYIIEGLHLPSSNESDTTALLTYSFDITYCTYKLKKYYESKKNFQVAYSMLTKNLMAHNLTKSVNESAIALFECFRMVNGPAKDVLKDITFKRVETVLLSVVQIYHILGYKARFMDAYYNLRDLYTEEAQKSILHKAKIMLKTRTLNTYKKTLSSHVVSTADYFYVSFSPDIKHYFAGKRFIFTNTYKRDVLVSILKYRFPSVDIILEFSEKSVPNSIQVISAVPTTLPSQFRKENPTTKAGNKTIPHSFLDSVEVIFDNLDVFCIYEKTKELLTTHFYVTRDRFPFLNCFSQIVEEYKFIGPDIENCYAVLLEGYFKLKKLLDSSPKHGFYEHDLVFIIKLFGFLQSSGIQLIRESLLLEVYMEAGMLMYRIIFLLQNLMVKVEKLLEMSRKIVYTSQKIEDVTDAYAGVAKEYKELKSEYKKLFENWTEMYVIYPEAAPDMWKANVTQFIGKRET